MSDLSDRLSSLSPERRELLEALLRKKRAAAASATTIPPRDGSGPCPLSFSQERLWLVHQLEPESPAYNMPSALRFEGELSVPALRESLAAIVRRHESLRTRFGLRNGQPVQEIEAAVEIPLPVVDLTELPPERREAEAVRLTGAEALRPFDLGRVPLLRPTLLKLSGRDHVLLATLHHIASDGWSMGIFARELGAFYRAARSSQTVPLPPLPIQYADFALWQRRTLSGPALDERLAFWREALSGLDPVLELPSDRPRPARRSPRGGAIPFTLPAALSQDVLELSRREGTTLFTTLLTAFLALLHRLTGKERLPVGTPVAGRSHLETEGLIGFFVDTLVVPSDLSAGPSFHEHGRRIGEFVLEAQGRSVPFERLVSELAPERSLAYSPVFQVLFALQNAPGGALEMPGLKVRGADLPLRTTKFDLSLFLWEEGGRLAGVLEHSLDLFDDPTVQRLAGHLTVLLAEMVANPDMPIRELPLLSPLARHQVLVEWNDAAASGFPEACLHELVAEQARRTPEAVAVSFEGISLTYRELDRRANRLAHRLRRLGAGPDTLVGLLTLRSLEMVVGLLGILKAGGAYVPLDPGHPEARWDLLLDEAGVGILLVQEPFAGRLDRQAVVLAPGGDLFPEESEEAPPSLAGPESLAYVLFTSGSTGTPKGVAVPHRAVVRLVKGRGDLSIGADEVWLQMAPLAFDASTLEIWGPLVNGGRLEVLGPDRPSLEEIGQAVEARQVTSLWLTAGLFHQMAEGDLSPLRGLRKLLAGGDVLSPAHVRKALEQLPGCRVINGYGPTENTTFTCCHPMTAPDEVPGAVPVGRPIAGTRAILLDRNGQLVPAGVSGELCAGGAGLARGYLGRPDLTAERFVPDPFPESPGERLYRTGDLARSLPDGRIDFLGRIDQQVKIRGFRIEPGEVEAALASHPDVRECVVLARRDRPGEVRLVAYVVAPGGREPRAEDLRRHLAERLPEAMVPSAFVFLETLPLTPNGKVDRRALPAPESPRETGEGYAAPSGPVEEILAGIWAEVLGLARVGIHDDFFALGGHSLLATQVASRLRSAFGVELPLRRLFEAPTIAELARAVREGREGRQAPPIVPVPREGDLPLSFAQQRLWFLDQLEPGSPAYNVPSAVRLSGEISAGELSRIFAHVVRRHEALRTTFAARDGRPVQVVAPALDVPLPVTDLSALPEAEREARAREIAADEARRPFDLARGPLLRLGLLRLGARDHVLLITLHHIVSDGWSMGVLLREIAALHEAFSTGRPAALPELPVQYADFAAWQREWLQGDVLEAQLAYWRRQLAGAPPVLDLPLDRPRPAVQTFRGASRDLILPLPLSEAVHGIGRREGATPFMVFLASWAAVLGRHAGQEDVLLGTPVAGRNRQEIEGLIGFFVNTLVMRTDLSGAPGFAGLLGQVRQTALDAYTHQDVPFERLVEELVPERDLAHSPLFQVLLVLQNAAGRGVSVPGLSLAPLAFESEVAKFDLSLTFAEREDRVFAGSVEYNVDLFDAGTVERLGARYRVLLEAAAANPDLPVFDLPLLTDAERRQLVEWNDTGAVPPSGSTLHDLFAAQAERTPDAVALVHGTSRWTYAELAARAGGLARRLRALGAGPEARVAVCLERSPDLIASLLGVLAAGGAYVPIDPAYPVERRTLMLEDSGAAVLVTRGSLSADLPETAAHRLDLDAEEIPGAELPRGGSAPGHLAYVIYTSGSTGRPKGVAIEHRSAVALALWAREELSAEELSGLMAATSVCFDLSVFEIFVPLAWGGTVVLADNALALPALPAKDEVRLLNTVPSAATELVRSGGLPPSVRTVCLAGEPLPASLVEALYATGTVERVLNLYGPSEDTTYSTGAVVPRKAERGPSIGRPLPGTRAWVVDRRGTPVPAGVAGELWLSGAGLARGYLGRPELTAERFIPDPFGGPGERVYRTGDLVRFRPDGELEFLGRIDHQVKIRGFRVELGEIEAALRSHPGVRECVVLAREDVPGLRLLVAYGTGDALPEAGALRSWLTARLPEYMVPTVFVPLEALPLTPNGKLDRRALPAPERTGSAEGEGHAAPADPVEELLSGIWTEVLKLDRVGAHDDFFALGGHSLLATQVVSRVRDVLGVELPVRRLFEAPTIAALARTVRESREGRQAPPIVPVPRTGDLPLSFAQRRLWLIDQLDPGNPAYNVPFAVRLRGEVRADLLARVFAEVVRRHEALRTTFASRDGKPVQVVTPELTPELPVLDLSHLPEAEREARAHELALEEARRPFDLARGPLLRLALARLGERDHLLLMTMHHIVSDGWSLGVLLSEIGALFAAFSEGRPSPLPELPVQYADFAAWQRTWLEGEVLDEQLAYWKRQLAGAPQSLELPTDRPRPAMQTFHGAVRSLALSTSLSDGVRELCRRHGATPFMALLAAWAVLLGRHAGQDDVLVGTPVAGRNRRETEGLIGFFINTLVMRAGMAGPPGFADLLGRIRAVALDAYAHQDLPFERLVEELVPERDLSRSPLFQVLFALQNAPFGALSASGLSLEPVVAHGGTTKFDLTLTLGEGPSGFAGALEHNTDLFDGSTVERLLARFTALLEGAVASPGTALPDLPLLAPEERQQLLAWGGAAGEPSAGTLHGRFEARVRQAPDAVAVVFEGESLTYGELNRRANRLAWHLRELGVGPDERVGLCAERSLELLVGLLGILKAGGAYVPLDPRYPAERLAYTLEDAGCRVLVGTEEAVAALPDGARRVLLEPDGLASLPEHDPEPLGDGASLAYVIYTSGSTGRPKGSLLAHGHVVRLFDATNGWFGFGERDVWTLFHSYAFDFSVWEIWGALLYGGRLVVVPYLVSRSPEDFHGLLVREGVTVLNQTPSAFAQLARVDGERGGVPTDLRLVIFGGEALDPGSVAAWFARHGDEKPLLVNMYGITETTVHVTYRPLRRKDVEERRSVIGGPIPDLAVHVLDPWLQPAPIGVPGELGVAGAGLARGYLGRPDLTAERFVPDPVSGRPGARVYRSGDLVRYLPDGELEYLGRIDHQVKIRGFRIELGEIEASLASHPAVESGVVQVLRNQAGEPLLAAWLVPSGSNGAPLRRLLRLEREGRLDRRAVHELPDGLTVAHLNRSETEFLHREIFADSSYLRHGIDLPPGAVVFDVGANIGLFSVFCAVTTPEPVVFAFEPIPEVFAVLCANADLYLPEARLFQCGLSDTAGNAEFTYYPHVSVVSSQKADSAEVREVIRGYLLEQEKGGAPAKEELEELLEDRLESRRVTCRLRTVSEVIREEGVERIDLLKVDVEKSELEVLLGVADEDWAKIRQVVIEVHDVEGRLERVRSLLAAQGFEVVVEQDASLRQTRLYNLYARRPGAPSAASQPEPHLVWSSPGRLIEDVRRHLRKRLPDYMVPSAFAVLDAFPLTPNGKVDRKALPAPESTRAADGGYVAPSDPIEEALAGIFAEVLGLDRVGVHDDFFASGGHSLLATQVMSRIRGSLGAELPLRRLFETPTVARLAQAVRESRDVRPAPPIVPVPRNVELPLSFAQQRLWFLDRLEPGSPAYNIPSAVRLDGELPVDLLARIFAEIVRRHETLRTTFAVHEGRPMQVIAPAMEPEIRRADLSQLPETEREAEARRLARAEALRPFDLERGPLLRLFLVRMSSREHLLLLTQHHIVSDGWSMGILLREIAALYEAFSQGRPSPLPELPVQYADFAAWQRSWLTGEALEAQIAYWRERLRGAPPVLELPTDRPRGASGGKAGAASRQNVIGPVLTRELKSLGQSRGATPFLLLLAAFDVLLYRWTGQTDLVVGSPIAGRNRLETEGLIGFFVNTLAIRSTFAGEAPFVDLLAQVRSSVIEDHAHQDLPFEKLVEELQPERSLHHTPLFQVMLNLLNTPRAAVELPGLTLAPFPSEAIPSKFELSLAVNDLGEDLVISAGYRAELFDPATIDRLLGHFEQILSGIVTSPERRIDELPLLTAAERHQLSEWSATRPAPLPDLLVHEIFEAQAARSPEAVALVCEGERLTCRELDRRANRLAHRLRRAGVGPETRVALLVERSLEMVIGLLGVLKAGGAYVPLDPTYPAARLAFMLEEAGARVLLVQEHLAGLLPAEDREVIVLAPGKAFLAGESEEPLPRLGSPESLAYVLFTSGSTGRPKGVAVEHRQLVHYTTAVLERLSLDGPASFATVSTLSADLGNTSVFPALFTGGALHVIKAERAADPLAMAEYLDHEPVDCLKIVPSHLRALRAFSRPAGVLPKKRLVFGGEALPWTDVDEVRALAPGLTVLNHYGPTESTVGVLTHRVADGAPRLGATVPLGRPLANVRTWVVDASGQLSPAGVPGELLLGGAGLARGYLGRPELTAARFVPNPFGPEAGARLYRTGDLVRHLPDGALEFLGRIDQQVKIRGFRVEPGEIEAVMKALPEVAEAVVLAREHAPGDRRLVAWLVPASGASPAPESLRRALQGVLPDALIPTAFVLLPALPLTPNGKVDRQALARQAPDGSAAPERVYTPPASPVEETLAEIWSSLLRVERVGRDDSFFDLGGHSLLATQLISRVRESFGIDIPLRSLFEAPTIARFGEAVLARQVESQDADDLERLLAELEELSDEEAEALADE